MLSLQQPFPLLSAIAWVALLGAGGPHTGSAAEEVPYGHPDFRPSAQRPIGFMGDGTGCYPGARPPLEFRDGTPADLDEPNPPHGARRVQVLADAKAKNILWKTEMPSWANTQPVVVGNQVFTTAEPNLLVAVDALTGTVQWTQEANPWEIAGVEPALAKRLQEMWHLANDGIPQFWAMTSGGTVCWAMPPEKLAPMLAVYRDKVQSRLLAALKELDPDGKYDAAAAATLKGLDTYQSGGKGKGEWTRERDSFRDAVMRRIKDLAGKNSVEMCVPWGHMVGLAINPPVSDGERIYVSFGQGQTVCYDLKGQRLWATRVALNRDSVNPGNLLLAPLLADDVLVDMHGGGKLRGLDKRTGRVLWEAPTQGDTPVKGGGYYVGSHRVMSLPGPDGVPVKIIVTTLCNLIRARDGRTLGAIPYEYKPSGGPTMLSLGAVVIKASNGDGFTSPMAAYRLKFTDADHIACEKLWEKGHSPGYHAQVGVGKWTIQGGSVYEVATGTVTYQNGEPSIGGHSQVLAGDRFFWTPDGSHRWGGRRPDGTVAHPLGAALFNADRLRFITNRNVLGESVPARVPAMEKYAPELYAVRDYEGQSYGRPAHLLNADCTVMPHGERLYIRTVNRLYCIGPAVKGTAQDDPQTAAKIRAFTKAADLLPYLDRPSALERYEAVLALGKLGTGAAEASAKLTALVKDDIYEEIRAAAVSALDAADPAGKPGTVALQTAVARSFTWEKGDPCLAQTLVLLGTDRAGAALIPLLAKDRDEATRVAAARALADAGLQSQQVFTSLSETVQTDTSYKVSRLATRALSSCPGDPALAASLRSALPKVRDNECQPGLFWYVLNNLSAAERTAFLMETAKGNGRMSSEAIRLAAEVRPPIPGLVEWMTAQGKTGDTDCIRNLVPAAGQEAGVAALAAMLTDGKAPLAAASVLLERKQREADAFAAVMKATTSKDDRTLDSAMRMLDRATGHADANLRKQAIEGLMNILQNTGNNGLKRNTVAALGRAGAAATPALDVLRGLTTHNDKGVAEEAAKAVKAIEAARAPVAPKP